MFWWSTTIIAGLVVCCLIKEIKTDSKWLPNDPIVTCDTVLEKFKDTINSEEQEPRKLEKIPIIIDTDLGMFPDDPPAIAIVHGFANQNRADILATVGSTRYEGIGMAIDTLNTYLGQPNIPIGVTRDPSAYTDQQGSQNWTEFIRTNNQHRINNNFETEDAILVYRRSLASAADRSVTILQLGHFTNLANLLSSSPDKISRLNGKQLVEAKVREVLTMAGKFPNGSEWNIKKDVHSARVFAEQWPTPVTFVGFEIGNASCGVKYQYRQLSYSNPLASMSYYGFQKYGNYNGCYDAVAALILDHEIANLHCAVLGTIKIMPDGSNEWSVNGTEHNKHRYLKRINGITPYSEDTISERIDSFLPNFTSVNLEL